MEKYESLDNPEAMLEGLRRGGTRVDLFTFMQIMPDTTPRYDYTMEWDNLAVLEVSTFDHWFNHQIRSLPRNRARQAEKKGVTLREAPFDDALVQGIWEVYNESAIRQGRPNMHYGKDLEAVRQHAITYLDRSIFIGAYLGEKMIGFIKMTCDEGRNQANLMNIVSMVRHRDKAPTNALIGQAVRSCSEHGIKHLVYQSFSYGKKQNDSLSNFKEINGFQRVQVPRYYVPLTALGRLALHLGLQRGLAERVPEPVLAKLRELRSSWYTRKLSSVTGAS